MFVVRKSFHPLGLRRWDWRLATFDSNPPGPQSDPHLTALASTIHDTADDSSGVSLGIHVVAQAREEERKSKKRVVQQLWVEISQQGLKI